MNSKLETFTLEILLTKDSWGDTPLHKASINGQLHLVPIQLLTLETMLVKDKHGETPLHFASRRCQLNLVPRHLLTLETMLVKNNIRETPLYWASRNGCLDQLLGIDFGASEKVKKIVGAEWWAENQALLHSKTVLVVEDTTTALMEMF